MLSAPTTKIAILVTSHPHCLASSGSPRPSACPASDAAASPKPMPGKMPTSMRSMMTLVAASSGVPIRRDEHQEHRHARGEEELLQPRRGRQSNDGRHGSAIG